AAYLADRRRARSARPPAVGRPVPVGKPQARAVLESGLRTGAMGTGARTGICAAVSADQRRSGAATSRTGTGPRRYGSRTRPARQLIRHSAARSAQADTAGPARAARKRRTTPAGVQIVARAGAHRIPAA